MSESLFRSRSHREGAFVPKSWWHFYRNLWERTGIMLSDGDYRRMIKTIKNGQAVQTKNGHTPHRAGYLVPFRRERSLVWINVIYDARVQAIITALGFSSKGSRAARYSAEKRVQS